MPRRSWLVFALIATLLSISACAQTPPPDIAAPLDGRGGGFIAFHSFRDGNSEIYVMNADGSGPKRVANDPGEDSCPNLARDASRILFTSSRDGNSEVYSTGLDGKDLQRLTETQAKEMHPVWTPDGTQIVFARSGDIWIMDADGQNQTQLTQGLRAELPFVVTADGQRIVFSDMTAGNYDVYVMSIDGGDITPVAASGDMEVFGTPAPDGDRLALMRGGRNIWVMGIDGSSPERLRTGAENPCWSPDGASIAFHAETGNYEIYRMGADGRDVVNLTRNAGNDFWPSWAEKPAQASGASHGTPAAEASSRLSTRLSAFGDLVGTSWVGRSANLPGRASDHLITWESELNGQVVRWSKTVDAMGFAMETFFFWDKELNKVAFVQLASNGSHAKGTVDVEGQKIALVGVTMGPEGVRQFRQTFELMPDGSLEDRFIGGHVIVYARVAGD